MDERRELDAMERLAPSAEHRLAQWESDPATGEATWSPAMFEILDYRPGEVVPTRRALLDRIHPDDRDGVRTLLESRAPTTNPEQRDCRIVVADGSCRHVSIEVFVHESEVSGTARLFGLVHDETHLHQARLDLVRTAARLGRVNRLGRDVSREIELPDILEAVGDALDDLVHPDRLSIALVVDDDPTQQELIALRGDAGGYERGARVPVLDVHRPLFDGASFVAVRYDGSPERPVKALSDHGYRVGYSVALRPDGALIGFLHAGWKRDVAPTPELIASLESVAEQVAPSVAYALEQRRRRDAESRTRQRQMLEAVGRLAAGVAHDFNNLLTVVMAACASLRQQRADDADVEAISAAADRAASLTRQLMAFGRQQVLVSEPIELNAVVRSMIELVDRMIGDDIQIVAVLTDDDSTIDADRSSIEQVIMTLAVNARDAMPTGGTLRIETARHRLEREAARAANAEPGDYVLLAISDTGVGVDEEATGSIFEPFFSTKTKSGGVGLGLATVYGIVMQNRGVIELDSVPGEGARFRLLFPHSLRRPTPPPAPEAPPPAHEHPRRTVLLAEDQPDVRRLVARALTRLGWEVLAAEDAEQALVVASEHEGAFDLLVTDIKMPGRSGIELATQLLEQRPDLPVLFMSGHTMDDALQPLLARGHRFVPKPFLPSDLVRAIEALLEARRA